MHHLIFRALVLALLCGRAFAAEPQKAPDSPKAGGAAKTVEPTNSAEAAAKKTAEDAATAEKYAALVASLPADQQKWERTLQENLGSFYLPIHKRLRVLGRASCWDFVADDVELPRVLLIGDSVSGGYTLPTRKALAGKVNVHKAPENCGPTSNGLKKLDVWLADEKWDLIHFNFGIHDRKTKLEDYEKRLEELIARLQKTGAKLVWASTTPIPAGTKDGPDAPAAIVERNALAARIVQKHGIAIDDLFAAITPHIARVMKPDDVHPNGEGYQLLGEQVASSILANLSGR